MCFSLQMALRQVFDLSSVHISVFGEWMALRHQPLSVIYYCLKDLISYLFLLVKIESYYLLKGLFVNIFNQSLSYSIFKFNF